MTQPHLLTLKEAAATLHGKISEGALRKAGREGKLTLYRVGNRDFTTSADLQGMIAQCQIQPEARASISENAKGAQASGQSVTMAEAKSAQATARMIALKLKGHSPAISPKNTRRPKASVTRLKPASLTS